MLELLYQTVRREKHNLEDTCGAKHTLPCYLKKQISQKKLLSNFTKYTTYGLKEARESESQREIFIGKVMNYKNKCLHLKLPLNHCSRTRAVLSSEEQVLLMHCLQFIARQ